MSFQQLWLVLCCLKHPIFSRILTQEELKVLSRGFQKTKSTRYSPGTFYKNCASKVTVYLSIDIILRYLAVPYNGVSNRSSSA